MSRNREITIDGLSKLGNFIKEYLASPSERYNKEQQELENVLRKAELENPWFTQENIKFCLSHWADLLTKDSLNKWLKDHFYTKNAKNIGLILAGNIPLVGFHDIICVLMSGHFPIIKLSSKDKQIIPFLLTKWKKYTKESIPYEIVEKLRTQDAIIATGNNNTARYLEYYFGDKPYIIRKSRTSIAVLNGKETDKEIQRLAEDIFRYYGMGCRNVTQLFIPQYFPLEKIFENLVSFKEIINHNQYANNYEYNKAIYLLNQEIFWDNNFVLLKESDRVFSPLAVVYFSRYSDMDSVHRFIEKNKENIQCIIASKDTKIEKSIDFGKAQYPLLENYADDINTLEFLQKL